MTAATLRDQAGRMFAVFAPGVLAADGDCGLEDVALMMPGVRAAKAHYDYCLGELTRQERATGAGTLNEALQRATRMTALLGGVGR
jgi:hypothetical protein